MTVDIDRWIEAMYVSTATLSIVHRRGVSLAVYQRWYRRLRDVTSGAAGSSLVNFSVHQSVLVCCDVIVFRPIEHRAYIRNNSLG